MSKRDKARNLERTRARCLAQVGIAESLMLGIMQQLNEDEKIRLRGDVALDEMREIDNYLRRVLRWL